MKRTHGIAVLALVFASASLVRAQTTIDTRPGNSYTTTFGQGGVNYMGQTFIAPSDNVLTSFTMFLRKAINPSVPVTSITYNFDLFLYDPDTKKTVGAALYTSGPFVTTSSDFSPTVVNTGGVALTAGAHYAALLDSLPYNTGTNGFADMQSTNIGAPGDAYTGGTIVFGNDLSSPLLDFTHDTNVNVDATFVANFNSPSAIPEASTGLLLSSLGLTTALLLRRRVR